MATHEVILIDSASNQLETNLKKDWKGASL